MLSEPKLLKGSYEFVDSSFITELPRNDRPNSCHDSPFVLCLRLRSYQETRSHVVHQFPVDPAEFPIPRELVDAVDVLVVLSVHYSIHYAF